jgi:head-tail adaptor
MADQLQLPAGSLRYAIQIQQQTATQDSLGQPLAAWSTFYSCRAAIDIQNSQLIYSTAEFMSKVTYRITMRWPGAEIILQPTMRIVYVEPATGITHVYEIQALINVQMRNRVLVCLAYELDGLQ